MGKRLYLYMVLLLLGSCGNSGLTEKDLPQLNGYWEIEQVVFPDGSNKDYIASDYLDHIQLEGLSGIRKKVRPTGTGEFFEPQQQQQFHIQEQQGRFFLHYKTPYSQWTEELLQLDQNSFQVVNEEQLIYRYKRFIPNP